MQTHAYDASYLNKAARTMGNMMHTAVIDRQLDGNAFLQQFIQSGIAEEFGAGNPKYIAGKSGAELFRDVLVLTKDEKTIPMIIEHYPRTDAYWAGWMLARYQWYSGKRFDDILDVISFDDFLALYPTMHEVDVKKCYETLDRHFGEISSRLQTIRKACGLTQDELAKRSGVSLHTIRAYECGNKDICKAQADTLIRLSKTLRCEIKDLLN